MGVPSSGLASLCELGLQRHEVLAQAWADLWRAGVLRLAWEGYKQ